MCTDPNADPTDPSAEEQDQSSTAKRRPFSPSTSFFSSCLDFSNLFFSLSSWEVSSLTLVFCWTISLWYPSKAAWDSLECNPCHDVSQRNVTHSLRAAGMRTGLRLLSFGQRWLEFILINRKHIKHKTWSRRQTTYFSWRCRLLIESFCESTTLVIFSSCWRIVFNSISWFFTSCLEWETWSQRTVATGTAS